MSNQARGTILLLGGTGKVASRIAPFLFSNGYSVLQASRSGSSSSLPNCEGVKFDWNDPTTYQRPFENVSISAIFLVAPPITDPFAPMKIFIDLAITKGVQRLVLLSASLMDVGDGPMMSKVSTYISLLNIEYAILRPTWFMENFSEAKDLYTIRNDNKIVSATGDGKVPFVSADDIAAIGYRALTDEVPHNTNHLILGPDLLSYSDVASLLSTKLGRKITLVKIPEDEAASAMIAAWGIPGDYARILAQLDTAIKNGEEERLNDVVLQVTGRKPKTFEEFVNECAEKGVWEQSV